MELEGIHFVFLGRPAMPAYRAQTDDQAASATMVLIWAIFRLPECKGRSYRELDVLFERKVPARKFKQTVVAEDEDE